MLLPRIEHRAWRQINYRVTTSLLAAEFLHFLYQRHDPFLNPTRFCNTVVVFKPWRSTSYAPVAEWDMLAVRFGGRLLRQPERVGTELERILSTPRSRSRFLAEQLEKLDVQSLSDIEIMDLLLETHHVPLGEIYEVNLVQVEHALHCAIRQRLREILGPNDTSVDRILAELCMTSQTTWAGEEERRFLSFILDCQEQGIVEPDDVEEKVLSFVERHRAFGAAYGAETVSVEGLKHRFREYVRLPRSELLTRLERQMESVESSSPLQDLVGEERDIEYLVSLFRQAGEFRDRNKGLLGRITKHRTTLLDQVAQRRRIEPRSTRLYLLEELMRLLEDGLEGPEPVIRQRHERGLVLSRMEHASWPESHATQLFFDMPDHRKGELRGLCASPGSYQGAVRIVRSAADLTRVRLGDVLVAEGTDLDLIPLLQMAGAIVTEEGGLLSHAAVLSRELRIPCVIEIPRATALLTDGYEVYVNADAGIVRPIVSPRFSDQDQSSIAQGVAYDLEMLPLGEALDPDLVGRKAASLARLAHLGFPVQEGMLVLPVSVCTSVARELASGKHQLIEQVAAALSRRYPDTCLNLRSSSPYEDRPEGSAAGIYCSRIGVRSDPRDIAKALGDVIASASGPAAEAYGNAVSKERSTDLAVIVGPYYQFTYQGAALSRSTWDRGRVLIECFESDGVGGCPDSGGFVLHVCRALADSAAQVQPQIDHLSADLLKVARLCLKVEHAFKATVEIEWGLLGRDPVLLQARPIIN
jgi:phosphohistidine swiveling domain-containing protein